MLEKSLKPYFKNKPFFEEQLLDSAGGVSNIKDAFKDTGDFWVINGDSFISYKNTEFLEEALKLHRKNNALATLIGVADKKPGLNGLAFDSSKKFTGLSKDDSSLHFIGLYLLNSEILTHFEKKPMKLFQDILLAPEIKDRVYIYKSSETIKWYETGNERDFIACMKSEAQSLRTQKENSFIYRTHKNWGLEKRLDEKLQNFLENKVWGSSEFKTNEPGDFVCIPEDSHVEKTVKLYNSALANGITLTGEESFKERLIVES